MPSVIPNSISGGPGYRPFGSELAVGEIAVNPSDGKIYTLTEAGEVVEIGVDQTARNLAERANDGLGAVEPMHPYTYYGWIAPGPSGSYISVGGEREYRDFANGIRRGALEVYGAAVDESGNPLAAEVIVCADTGSAASAFKAATKSGTELTVEAYGHNQTSGTFGSRGPGDGAIYVDYSGGATVGTLAIGLRYFFEDHEVIQISRSALDVNGVITVSPGTAAAPAIVSTGDPNTGIFFPSADALAISTGGVERLRVGSLGNVGIGTTDPTAELHVFKDGANADIKISNHIATDGMSLTVATNSVATINQRQNAPLVIATNNTEAVRIDQSGNVGIGNTNPSSALDVDGVITVSPGSAAAPAIVSTGDPNTGVFFPSADAFAISTAGVERLRVNSSGHVGIGTPSPFHTLRVDRRATGQTVYVGVGSEPVIRSDVTASFTAFRTNPTTESGSYTVGKINHYLAAQFPALGAGSAVTDIRGFVVDESLGGKAANTYGLYGELTSAANTWNIYCSGSAPNYFAGRVGIGTTEPSARLDINDNKIRLRTAKTPASASDTGNAGDICWDSDYVYVCVGTNTWKRSALTTW